jgi:large subunit ribosomal protein L29
MPIVRLKEINDMNSEEKSKKLAELRAELSRLRTMISAGGSVDNPARIRELRRTIARILTVENQEKKAPKKPEKQEKPKPEAKETKPAKKPAKAKAKEKKKE